jgi:hypothetical protein
MGLRQVIARVPAGFIVAASAWSPVAPFRSRPFAAPCYGFQDLIIDLDNRPTTTCIVNGDSPLPFTTADIAAQPKVI